MKKLLFFVLLFFIGCGKHQGIEDFNDIPRPLIVVQKYNSQNYGSDYYNALLIRGSDDKLYLVRNFLIYNSFEVGDVFPSTNFNLKVSNG